MPATLIVDGLNIVSTNTREAAIRAFRRFIERRLPEGVSHFASIDELMYDLGIVHVEQPEVLIRFKGETLCSEPVEFRMSKRSLKRFIRQLEPYGVRLQTASHGDVERSDLSRLTVYIPIKNKLMSDIV